MNRRIRPMLCTLLKTGCGLGLAASLGACIASTPPEMTRTPINPDDWAAAFLHQGEVIEGANRILSMSGQVAVVDDPDAPFGVTAAHPGDMRAQMAIALANIDDILAEAGMSRSDLIHLRFFVTDMEAGLTNADVFLDWIGETDIRPPQSFIGINELFLPGLVIEIEAAAATH